MRHANIPEGRPLERASKVARSKSPKAPRAAEKLDYGRLDGLLGYHLRKAQQATFRSFANALAGENMSPGHLGVLLVVAANPGVNQITVGQAMGIDRSTLVAVLDRLEDRGLLERTPSPSDRRSHALLVTEGGRAYLAELMPRVEAHENEVAATLSEDERRTLIALLRRVGKS